VPKADEGETSRSRRSAMKRCCADSRRQRTSGMRTCRQGRHDFILIAANQVSIMTW